MPAILCESLGKVLKGFCEGVGAVLTLPCKACGCATDRLTKLCASPFCLYLTVALGLNLPPIVFAATAFGARGGGEGCRTAWDWLGLNAVLCVINAHAAMYISAKMSHDATDENAAPFMEASVANHAAAAAPAAPVRRSSLFGGSFGGSLASPPRSVERVKDVLCYDPLVALYIVIGIFYMVWQAMGAGRTGSASDCGEAMDDALTRSLICGFLFIMLGGMTFACSLCCLVRSGTSSSE